MDQSELREWESRCTQEEPPACRAACPLHVDAREFCIRMAENRPEQAWAELCRTLPLPSVMARICDAPCKAACLRKDAGGAVEIGALERACAELAAKNPPLHVQPRSGRRAAVVGSDMAALTAAWDLARKGVETVLYCSGSMSEVLDGLPLPSPYDAGALRPYLERELKVLSGMGVEVREHTIPSPSLVDEARTQNRLVFVAPDATAALRPDEGPPDPVTLGTVRNGVFAAMRPEAPEQAFSPVILAALGRRAAISMDRFFQGATLVTGREREGVFSTRLFTNLSGTAPVPPEPVPQGGYDKGQAVREASRCIRCECMECVKHCAYLAEYGSYPKQYTRRIYNNESIVMGTRQANTMINSCMLCGLCGTLCPEGFDMGALCLQSRQGMVKRGKMPPSAHEFALRDMQFANGPDCALARHAPDAQESAWVFFPGCQLTASMPDAVERVWLWLREHMGGRQAGRDVGLMLRCCGIPARWAGQEEMYARSATALRERWKELGSPRLVTACPTCTGALGGILPDGAVYSLWEVLAHHAEENGELFTPADRGAGARMVLHDPCGTRHNAALRLAVRNLLRERGIAVAEPELTGEHTECCGFGGLSENANPALGKKIREGRAQRLAGALSSVPAAAGVAGSDAPATSAGPAGPIGPAGPATLAVPPDIVTYCAMCRDMLAKTGKRVLHLLDILLPPEPEPEANACCGEGAYAVRPVPGYSGRRENRVRLRERLLAAYWKTEARTPLPHETLEVDYTGEALQRMEERRILDSDIRKVLHAAATRGAWLENVTDSVVRGHRLAMFRPNFVTYWVEFTMREDGGYLVHNAWSHRMRIIPPKPGACA